jgi:DNA segregation ATPase FtsK/SpoIIIE-like protein
VATGLAGTGAERLLGQGDFLVIAKGRATRMQAAYLDAKEAQALVARLRAGARPLLLASTGTDGRDNRLETLTGRLRSQLRRIK